MLIARNWVTFPFIDYAICLLTLWLCKWYIRFHKPWKIWWHWLLKCCIKNKQKGYYISLIRWKIDWIHKNNFISFQSPISKESPPSRPIILNILINIIPERVKLYSVNASHELRTRLQMRTKYKKYKLLRFPWHTSHTHAHAHDHAYAHAHHGIPP